MPLPLKLLIWSHDHSGLGYTARALAMAAYLTERFKDCSVILVTDLPIIGRFRFPSNVDYVRLPGLASNGDGNAATSLDRASTLKIRRKMLQGIVRTFRPQFVVLERDPLNFTEEVERILTFVHEELNEAKVIWALPDVLGEPESIVASWTAGGVYPVLDALCDEIWVHGDQALFDQARHYRLPERVAAKVVYTGYLRSPRVSTVSVQRKIGSQPRIPLVLLTAGGGAAGYPLMNSYLDFLEGRRGQVPFRSVIVTGPLMRSVDKQRLKTRAERLSRLTFHRFSRHLLEYLSCADLVVSTGGYNTLCANLSYHKPAIVAPRVRPPNERLLRGRMFERLGITQVLDPVELGSERLGEMVTKTVLVGEAWANGHAGIIPMEGLEQVGTRIEALASAMDGVRQSKAAPRR